MIRQLKDFTKTVIRGIQSVLFRRRKYFPFLSYFPKGREMAFDIINYYGNNKAINIVDVGANIGQSVHYFKGYFPASTIYAFEPVPDTFAKLKKNIASHTDVQAFNIALGEGEYKTTIIDNKDSSGLNSLVAQVNTKLEGKSVSIDVTTLDAFLKLKSVDRIGVLKIDTEGFEMQVLAGAESLLTEGRIDFIYCEVGFKGEDHKTQFADLNAYLWARGYYFAGLYQNYRFGPSNIFVQFSNALYVRIK